MARLVLLDRDGVVNYDSPAFIRTPDEWRPIPGSLDAIARLKHAGWLVAVCSNQSGVGRGLIEPAMLEAIHDRLRAALAECGGSLDALLYCPHHPAEGCTCRKPAPGLLLAAMAGLGVSAGDCVAIGDSLRDIEAGKAAGCRTILVRTGNGRAAETGARQIGVDAVYDDLSDAVNAIEACTSWS